MLMIPTVIPAGLFADSYVASRSGSVLQTISVLDGKQYQLCIELKATYNGTG